MRVRLGDAASSSPLSVADKSHQFFLAKLNVLQVRDIWKSGTGGIQSGGGRRGCTGYWEGRDMGCRVQGGHGWPEASWTSMGIVGSLVALEVTGGDLRGKKIK